MRKRKPTRAEIVRRRRAARRAASERLSRPLPPMTVRVEAGELSLARQPTRRARRRYQATLALPGARLRAPSLPRVRVTWRWFSLALVLGILYALYMLWASPMFYVNGVEVYGQERIRAEEIQRALDLDGWSIFWIVPEEVERNMLLAFREIESVSVSVSLPNRVTVTVRERQPVIMWQQEDGYTWIDANGIAFRPHGQADNLVTVFALSPPPAPPATGNPDTPAPFISPEMVQALLSLAPYVPDGMPILYDPAYGLGWDDPRGWRAILGSPDDVERKVHVYQALVDHLAQKGVQPSLINVAYPDAPFYRLER